MTDLMKRLVAAERAVEALLAVTREKTGVILAALENVQQPVERMGATMQAIEARVAALEERARGESSAH